MRCLRLSEPPEVSRGFLQPVCSPSSPVSGRFFHQFSFLFFSSVMAVDGLIPVSLFTAVAMAPPPALRKLLSGGQTSSVLVLSAGFTCYSEVLRASSRRLLSCMSNSSRVAPGVMERLHHDWFSPLKALDLHLVQP